jgi:hypothetical protein
MDDERVDRLLRALPRESASPGFTARVVARLEDLERIEARAGERRVARLFGLPRLTLPAVVLAATLAVAASLSLQGGGALPQPPATSAASAALAASATSEASGASAALATSASRQTLLSGGGHGRHGGPARLPGTVSVASASSGRTRNVLAAREARALLREIRTDHLRLHDEMRRHAAQNAKIYLGGDEDADLVVHLDQVRELPDRQADPPPYQYD